MDWNCHYIHPWSGVSYSKLLVLRLDSNLRIVLEANRALTRLEPSWSRDCVGVLKWFCLIFKQNTLVYLRKSPDDFIHLRMATPALAHFPPPIKVPAGWSCPDQQLRIPEWIVLSNESNESYFRMNRTFEWNVLWNESYFDRNELCLDLNRVWSCFCASTRTYLISWVYWSGFAWFSSKIL